MATVLITGSSGYVASDLIPHLKKETNVFGVDKRNSNYSDLEAGIESREFKDCMDQFYGEEMVVVNLAAARFDFGATAPDYHKLNVECHQKFLKVLSSLNVRKFIHVSSVAALDGRNIAYSETLDCDDAYRATKYLQEVAIQKWCDEHNVALTILYPSAIFSDDPRSDTNIGKLQSVSKLIPFIPKIEVIKSLTYLPFFSKFIIESVAGKIPCGKYLTIEKSSLTVSQMIQVISGRPTKLVNIPFLPEILKITAKILYVLGLFGRVDLMLTPNRVVKLFSDTSYSHVNAMGIDTETYGSRNCIDLPEILAKFTRGVKSE